MRSDGVDEAYYSRCKGSHFSIVYSVNVVAVIVAGTLIASATSAEATTDRPPATALESLLGPSRLSLSDSGRNGEWNRRGASYGHTRQGRVAGRRPGERKQGEGEVLRIESHSHLRALRSLEERHTLENLEKTTTRICAKDWGTCSRGFGAVAWTVPISSSHVAR